MSKGISTGMLLFAALLTGCGGGSSGSSSPPPPPPVVTPPSALSYPSPHTFVMGTPITALNPTVTGTVTSYSVNPALPAGLALSGTTGVVSGTPSAPAAATNYVVTASNSGGSTTANLSITVNAVLPAISYPRTQLRYSVGNPIPQLDPANTGGPVVTWSVTPALPAGLTLNSTNGSIAGAPTALAASASYVVSATNSGGHSDVTLTIAVESGVLVDLGHGDDVRLIQYSGSRMFSQDLEGHWNLWDAGTTARVASGNSDCVPGTCAGGLEAARLAGNTLVIRSNAGFDIRNAVDGTRNASFNAAASWWELASDGSYLCAGTASALTAWDAAGTQLFSRAGDYSNAKVFAAPSEIRVAIGPAGSSLIEKLTVPGGVSTPGTPFMGQFHSWFIDGGRFLTNLANTVWTYSHAGVQQDIDNYPSVTGLTGQGNFVWAKSNSSTLTVYSVGSGATPVATLALPVLNSLYPSNLLLGVAGIGNSSADLWVIDLSGAAPAIVHHDLKYPYVRAFGGLSASQWAMGDDRGVVVDPSTPAAQKVFARGEARAVAGSSTRVAVATAVGTIYFYSADSLAPEGELEIDADQVALSDDGSVLALRKSTQHSQYGDLDWSVEVYALPAKTLIRKWTYTYPATTSARDIALSASGSTLAQLLRDWSRSVETIAPGPVIWSDQYSPQDIDDIRGVFLSPSGNRSATADGRVPSQSTATVIRQGPSVVTAVPGIPVGWIDESRLLTNIYVAGPSQTIPTVYDHATIVDSQGQQIATLALPKISRLQTVSSSSIYSPDRNTIYSLTDGSVVWASPNGSPSFSETAGANAAIAGGRAIFSQGPLVRAEPY